VRCIAAWLAALAAMAATAILWGFATPILSEMQTQFNATLGGELSGQALDVFNTLWSFCAVLLKLSPALVTLALLAWAYLNMQRREVVTGRY